MTISEVVVTVLSILVSSVVSGVAIYYARKSARIAEEQATQHPALEVVQVDWGMSESIKEKLLLVEEARLMKEREEDEELLSQYERLVSDVTQWSASTPSLEERAAEE
jgi:hypothetical protein